MKSYVVMFFPLMAAAAVWAADPVTNVTWKSSVSLGASYKSGNTDQTLFTGDFKADRTAPSSDWLNSLHGEYGKTDGEQTEGQVRIQSDYRHKFRQNNFFGGVFGEGLHDSLKQIRLRAKIGPNIGYYFIRRDDMKLSASFGVNYVYEKNADDTDNYGEYRLAGDYEWQFSETANYYLHIEYAADMSDIEDNTGLLVTGVKSKLSDKLALFIELRDEYDSTVTGDVEHNDLTVTAGLTYDIL